MLSKHKASWYKRRLPMISRPRLPSRGWKQPLVARVARAGLISIPRCGRRRTVDTTPDAYTLSFHCSARSNHSSQSYLWSWRCSNVTSKLRDSSCDLFVYQYFYPCHFRGIWWRTFFFNKKESEEELGNKYESGSRSTSHDYRFG